MVPSTTLDLSWRSEVFMYIHERRMLACIVLLMVLALLAFITSVILGSVSIPVGEAVSILFGGESDQSSWKLILLDYRVPKAITAFSAGSALAISGLLMQTYFRNPLAGPFVLGVSSGASLGVAIAVMLLDRFGIISGFFNSSSSLLAACVGSFLVTAIILVVARAVNSPTVLLLVGLMLGYASGGLVNLIVYMSEARQIQSFMIWSFGSFARVSWEVMPWLLLPIVVCLLCSAFLSKPLNALQLGQEYASSMGIPIRRVRVLILLLASLLAGTATAFCGPVAFVGIAVPHIARLLLASSDHRFIVPACIFLGGTLCLMADLISQLPGMDQTLPLNAITSLLGAPIVIWILLKSRKKLATGSVR